MLLGVDRKNISLHTNRMFAIMMPDISEIQVLSLSKRKNRKGMVLCEKTKNFYTVLYTN